MKSWTVTARGLASVQVEGTNWIVALGRGLDELGRADELSRLACEVLPNGTVIARDIASGTGYIVQSVDGSAVVATPPLGEQAVPMGGSPDDELDDEPLGEEPTPSLVEEEAELAEGTDPMVAIDAADSERLACQIALNTAIQRVSAESGAVILEERGYLRFSAVRGPHSGQLEGVRLPAGTGVAGYAIASRRSVVLGNAHEDPRHFGELDARTGYVTRQMAVIPVQHGDRVLGVVEVMNREEASGGRFVEADVSAVEEVAAALARRLLR